MQPDSLLQMQVSETVRAFSQGGGSGRVKMCEAAGVPLEQYQQAQQKVDEKQDEFNKLERKIKSCKKKLKPLVRAMTGLRTCLKTNQAKAASLESGGIGSATALHESDFESAGSESKEEDSDSDGEVAPGEKRKSSKGRKPSGSSSKRRRKSVSESESDLELFMSSDDDGDESSEEEEQQVAAPAKGPMPKTLPELQAQAAELQEAINEKNAIAKTLRADQRFVAVSCW